MSIQMMLIIANIIAFAAYGFAKNRFKPRIFRLISLAALLILWASILYFYIFTRQSLIEPRWNIIPFQKDALTDVFYREFIINVLIYMLIRFSLSGIFPQYTMINTILIGIGISISFESINLLVHIGVCDINDFIASSIGCTLGVLLAQISKSFQKLAHHR